MLIQNFVRQDSIIASQRPVVEFCNKIPRNRTPACCLLMPQKRPKHLRSHPWANHAAIAGLEWRTPAFIHESGAEPLKEHDMRQCVLMIIAAGAVTAFAGFPAQAQY